MDNKKLKIKEIFSLAFQFQKKNNFLEAEKLYKQILDIDSNNTDSIFFLGLIYAQSNNYIKAKTFFERVIKINSKHIDANYNLGLVFEKLKDFKNAINYYEKTIKIDGRNLNAINNLGIIYHELKEYKKAISYYNELVKANPNDPEIYNMLGIANYKLGEFKKATDYYYKAIEIDSNYIRAHNNLGVLFHQTQEFNKSKKHYEKAIEIDPHYVDAHFSLGMLFLSMSDFNNGFKKYEWRKKLPGKINISRLTKSLEWNGEDLNNKTILIESEQGLGDIIQFSRYLYLLNKKYSVNIIFRTIKKVSHLFFRSKFKVISEEDSIPKHDYYKHLMSLPKIFFEKNKTFAPALNFIPRDKKIILKWKEKLSSIKGFKVGINWQGDNNYLVDHLRSVPLNSFEELFKIKNVNFINLQKGFGLEQIKNFKFKNKIHDFSSEVDNGQKVFEDTIGILDNIDLLITIDSSLAHLSATMGRNTWVMLHLRPDWRWNLITKEFSWYENIKIYRQKEINKWDFVLKNIKKDLVASL